MKSFAQLRKDPIIVLGGMIVMLTLVVGAGFFFLYFKSELDVKQVGNEVGIIRSMLTTKAQLEGVKTTNGSSLNPLTFSTGNLDVTVNRRESMGYSVSFEDLKGSGEECGHPQSDTRYRNLVQQLGRAKVIQYDITSNKPSQDPTYTVYAVENTPEYKTLNDVNRDLEVCAAGGVYPNAVNTKWILLTGSCGGAVSDDLPGALCGNIQQVVDETLKLVE
jgi:hypothetical protein